MNKRMNLKELKDALNNFEKPEMLDKLAISTTLVMEEPEPGLDILFCIPDDAEEEQAIRATYDDSTILDDIRKRFIKPLNKDAARNAAFVVCDELEDLWDMEPDW